MAVTSLRGTAAARVRAAVATLGRPAGFGARVMVSAVATVVLVVMIAVIGAGRPARPQARGGPPWPAPGQVAAGARAAGLEMQPATGQVMRYAVHLDVIVDGQPVTVPAGIGVDERARLITGLFTGDTSGIIHVASDSQQEVFTLGQFFAEWQVALAADRLGGLRVSRHDPVGVYLNGSRVTGDPGSLVLEPHQEVVVAYRAGSAAIPASYAFPPGV
jgi:hypothetical protein